MFGRLMSIRAVALATALSVSVSACQTTGMGSSTAEVPLTPDRQQLRDDADQFNETMLGGAAPGAWIGAWVGRLCGAASGKGEDIAGGALIGAAAGGVPGGVDGYVTAKAQENSNNQVRMLNSMAEDVRTDNQRLERIVANSDQVLADSKEQPDRIRNASAAKTTSVAEPTAHHPPDADTRPLTPTPHTNPPRQPPHDPHQ